MNAGMGVGTSSFSTVGRFTLTGRVNVIIMNPRSPLIGKICSCFGGSITLTNVPIVKPSGRKTRLRNDGSFTGTFVVHRGVPATHCGDVSTKGLRRKCTFLRRLRTPCMLGTSNLTTNGNILVLSALRRTGGRLSSVLKNVFNSTDGAIIVRRFLSNVRYSIFIVASNRDCGILPITGSCGHVNRNGANLGANKVKTISPIPFTSRAFVRGISRHVVHPAVRKLGTRGVSCGNFVFLNLVGIGNRPVIVRCGYHVNSPRARIIVLHVRDSLIRLLRNITRNGLNDHALIRSPHTTMAIVLMDNNCPRTCRGKGIVDNLSGIPTRGVVFRTKAGTTSKRVLADNNHIVTIDSCKTSGRRTLTQSFTNTGLVSFRGGCFHGSVKFSLWVIIVGTSL